MIQCLFSERLINTDVLCFIVTVIKLIQAFYVVPAEFPLLFVELLYGVEKEAQPYIKFIIQWRIFRMWR